jgi:hypothetical protein
VGTILFANFGAPPYKDVALLIQEFRPVHSYPVELSHVTGLARASYAAETKLAIPRGARWPSGRPKLSSLYDFFMAASATLKWGQKLITLSREIVPGNAIFVSKRH